MILKAHLTRIIDFPREKAADRLQLLISTVHVISQEKVAYRIGAANCREYAVKISVLKDRRLATKSWAYLSVDVADDIDRGSDVY